MCTCWFTYTTFLQPHPQVLLSWHYDLPSASQGMHPLTTVLMAHPSPLYSPSTPFHSTSSYSFGLEETNYRVEAAELGYKSLSLQPRSPWATHTICHVVEESRDAEEGVELLERTRKDWESSILGNHISWHLALHYLGQCTVHKHTLLALDCGRRLSNAAHAILQQYKQ